MSNIADKIEHGVKYVKEGVQEKTSEAKYEGNKEKAKSSEQPMTERVKAAGTAVKDKVEEITHGGKKEFHKESAQSH